jgi:HEPN domain-containing protein
MTKDISAKWFKQAQHDLEMAEKNIAIGGFDIAAFLSHQAIEKLLKAVFAFEGQKIPKSHYIDEMARELNLPQELIDDILDLTVDYTLARYPDVGFRVPFEEYTEEIAREKVKRAQRVFAEVRPLKLKMMTEEGEND